MTLIDDLEAIIAQLPEEIIPGPASEGGTGNHTLHSELYRQGFDILRQLALEGAGGEGAAVGWVDFGQFGEPGNEDYDWTEAIQTAVDTAVAIGAEGVKPPLSLFRFQIGGRVDFKDRELEGFGPEQTIFECTDAAAGFDFTAYGDPSQPTGHTRNFSIWGGPGPNAGVALRPLVVGLRVSANFSNIHSFYADQDDGINLVIAATQNSHFDTIWCVDAAENVRWDAGASFNVMSKSEIAGATRVNTSFRESTEYEHPPTQFAYCLANVIEDTIFEAPGPTTEYMVESLAGAMNVLRHCSIGINGPLFGLGLPTGMTAAVYAAPVESFSASLVIEHGYFNGENACDVAYHAAAGALIHVSGGTMQKVATCFKGNVRVHAWPWMISTAGSTAWSEAIGPYPSFPFCEMGVARVQVMEDLAHTWQYVIARGGTHSTFAIDGLGLLGWGTEALAIDTVFGRLGVGIVGTTGKLKALGTVISSYGLAAPTATATALGGLGRVMPIYNPSDGTTLMGYIPVYNSYS